MRLRQSGLLLFVIACGMVANARPDEVLQIPNANLAELSLDTPEGFPLTLDDCIQTAIRAATLVIKSQNSYELSGSALIESYMQFLPNLTATASTNFFNGTQYFTTAMPTLVSGSGNSGGYALNATLNIFNGLSDVSGLRASRLRKEASHLSLQRAKQTIALNVAQSFMTVILDNKLVEIAQKNFQKSQAREQLLIEQARVGAKSLADLFRQKAQTSSDEALYLSTENKRRSDQVALLQQLRFDVTKKYHFVDLSVRSEKEDNRFSNEEELLRIGLENRTDLKATQNVASAAGLDVTRARATYLPRLDLQAGLAAAGGYLYSQNVAGTNAVPASQSPVYSQLGSQTEYSLGLVLTWQIFDRFVTHQAVAQATYRENNATTDSQDMKNQVQADVRLAYSNYKTARQLLRASKEGLVSSQKAYEVIGGRYEFGSANFIDLITSQTVLLQAESAQAQALINFILQGEAVAFAIGESKFN